MFIKFLCHLFHKNNNGECRLTGGVPMIDINTPLKCHKCKYFTKDTKALHGIF